MPRFVLLAFAVLSIGVMAAVSVYPPVFAQGSPVTVPNLTGLSIPAAAALLNQNGLALGLQSDEPWTEGLTQPANTVSAQSLPPGTAAEPGTSIDVTVLRTPNMLLVYRARVITLINQSDTALPLNGLAFNALDGNTAASFPATNWLGTLNGGGRCVQLWAEPRTGPEKPDECTGLERWLSTTNAGVHFWTDLNGVSRFSVVYEGVERTVCEGAALGQGQKQCAFFLPTGTAAETSTGYVYLAYTTDRLIVLNQSADQWMPLAQTTIYNYNPNVSVQGVPLIVGDPALFNNPATVADLTRLAPGQCLLFTNKSPDAISPPEACHVIAQLAINPSLIFWGADFEVDSITDGRRHTCPAATAGKMTICVMPR